MGEHFLPSEVKKALEGQKPCRKSDLRRRKIMGEHFLPSEVKKALEGQNLCRKSDLRRLISLRSRMPWKGKTFVEKKPPGHKPQRG